MDGRMFFLGLQNMKGRAIYNKWLLPLLLMLFVFSGTRAFGETQVPNFSLPSVPEQTMTDIRDFRGKVVLITFWATWCGPCVQEIPSLKNLHEEYGPKGFSVIGISMDQGGSRVVVKMMEKTGINYPILMGNAQVSQDFGGIYGIPTSFLVDRSGKILRRYTGWVSHDVFAKDIEEIIN